MMSQLCLSVMKKCWQKNPHQQKVQVTEVSMTSNTWMKASVGKWGTCTAWTKEPQAASVSTAAISPTTFRLINSSNWKTQPLIRYLFAKNSCNLIRSTHISTVLFCILIFLKNNANLTMRQRNKGNIERSSKAKNKQWQLLYWWNPLITKARRQQEI